MAWDSTEAKRCNLIDMKSIHVVTADRHMIISTGNNGKRQVFVDEYSGKNLLWEATASAEKWEQPVNTPALTVDAAGSVFVAGGYNGTASFGTCRFAH